MRPPTTFAQLEAAAPAHMSVGIRRYTPIKSVPRNATPEQFKGTHEWVVFVGMTVGSVQHALGGPFAANSEQQAIHKAWSAMVKAEVFQCSV